MRNRQGKRSPLDYKKSKRIVKYIQMWTYKNCVPKRSIGYSEVSMQIGQDLFDIFFFVFLFDV